MADSAGVPKKMQLIKLEPENISFDMVEKEPTVTLKIYNTSEKMVAFKVKTTHRRRYLVRPNQDVIPVGLKSSVKITLQMKDAKQLRQEKISGMKTLDKEYSDNKFLVQCTVIDPSFLGQITEYHSNNNSEELGKKMKEMWEQTTRDRIVNQKLKCLFQYPDDMGALLEANNVENATIPFSPNIQERTNSGESLSTAGAISENFGNDARGDDIAELRKRYNELVNFTVQLTAERDRYKLSIKDATKEIALLKKGQTARLNNVRDMDEQGSAAAAAGDKSASGIGFSLWQIMLVAVFAFLMGRIFI